GCTAIHSGITELGFVFQSSENNSSLPIPPDEHAIGMPETACRKCPELLLHLVNSYSWLFVVECSVASFLPLGKEVVLPHDSLNLPGGDGLSILPVVHDLELGFPQLHVLLAKGNDVCFLLGSDQPIS